MRPTPRPGSQSPRQRGAGRRRRAFAAVSVLALSAATLWLATRPEEWFHDEPRAAADRRAGRFFSAAFSRNPGLVALWTFDERDAGGWFSDDVRARSEGKSSCPAAHPGTTLVPGRHGSARRFSGSDSFIDSGRHWSSKNGPFSIVGWLRIKPRPARQDVLCTCDAFPWGLRIEGGDVCFDWLDAHGERRVLRAAFPRNKWTHVALVASPGPGGSLRLFVGGRQVASADAGDFRAASMQLAFGLASRFQIRDPLRGEVDDFAVFSTALSAADIRRIESSRHSLAALLAGPAQTRKLALARASAALRSRLGALLHPGRRASPDAGVPDAMRVSLRLATGELRRLLRSHAAARRSDGVADSTARPADGFVSIAGRIVRCRVSLHGTPNFCADSPRPSFLLVPGDPGETFPGGERALVLSPPESCGGLYVLGASLVARKTGLLAAPNCEPAALFLNGLSRGLYLARDFTRAFAVAGLEARPEDNDGANRSIRAATSQRAVAAPEAWSDTVRSVARCFLTPQDRAAIGDRLILEARRFAEDSLSPLPPRRRSALLLSAAEAWNAIPPGPPDAASAPLEATLFAGPAGTPERLESDIPLGRATAMASAVRPDSLRFRSSRPDVIADDGSLLSRPDSKPLEVPVTATYRDDSGAERTETLLFRVAPRESGLPALCVWSGPLLDKLRASDAAAEWRDPDTEKPVRFRLATDAGGGGLRQRGNSSFKTGRKSLWLKTDAPFEIFGEDAAASRALVVAGGVSDPLCLGNSLAFGLFRDWERTDGGTNVAPQVVRAELFVNGRYAGLREIVQRPDRALPGSADAVFFRHVSTAPQIPYMRPSHAPSRKSEDAALDSWSRLHELLDEAAAVSTAPQLAPNAAGAGRDWQGTMESLLDRASAADLYLLSDLLGNVNGYPRCLPFDEIMRFRPAVGRFDFVPWDFDLILRDGERSSAYASDRLFFARLDGWRDRVAARWRLLRAGPCSDAALTDRFQSLLDETDGWLVFNERYRKRLDGAADPAPLRQLADNALSVLLSRAARLDSLLGDAAAGFGDIPKAPETK